MIKIFSTDKVRTLDQYTIQNEPISSIDLVERAATTFTSEFCRRYSKQNRIIVFAGQGNNGADGLRSRSSRYAFEGADGQAKGAF